MGLTIHYTVRAPRLDFTQAKALIRSLRREAQSMQRRGEVERVLPATTDPAELARWAVCWKIIEHPTEPDTSTGIAVEPLEGCIFPVVIGEGCEPLWLGLCRYPASVTRDDHTMATKLGSGWQLRGSCKTQYASLHGWENFHRCHTSVVTLLRFYGDLGARVRITDEGEWWPRRSDTTLRRKLDEMNGIVAAVAGAIKDTGDDGAPRAPKISPIFAHPQFERLEAEGATRHSSKVANAVQIISDLPPATPPSGA